MKKITLALFSLLFFAVSAFAQSDLQVLAIVKLNKSETITVKQLKNRCDVYQKQVNRGLTVDERKSVLDTLIEEKLVLQAAQKAGLSINDSYVDQYFAQGMSQAIGANVTEKELADLVKKTQGVSLDTFLINQVGMNVADYKSYLRNQLLMQQYVVQQKQNELQKVAPTDEEIRMAYESNKAQFVQNDIAKLFLVIVPKNNDPDKAKNKLNELLNKYLDKKMTTDQIAAQSGTDYQAGELLIPKNEVSANNIGMSLQSLLYVFTQDIGFCSGLQETDNDYRFLSLLKKYDAKMLGLSDIVQPESTVTVYDYIRSSLTQQKQMVYIQQAAQEISKSLNTSANVEMKKSGSALTKLLDWGE